MKKFIVIFMVLAVLVAGCTPASSSNISQNGMEISNARVVLPGGDAMSGMDSTLAAYMVIKNTSSQADRLTGVSVDFGDASLHQTSMNGDVMKMDAVSSLDLPAGEMVELRSGSYHVMIMNLTKDLKVNDVINIVLEFEKAGKISIPVKVTDQ